MRIPIPTNNESEEVEDDGEIKPYVSEKFIAFWYVPDWTCPKCEAVMFGRMTYCIYCKQRLHTHTPRPD